MLHVMARITLRPQAAAGFAVFGKAAAAARAAEPACLPCEVFRRQDAPHAFRTVGRRTNRAGFDARMASGHVARAFAVATPLLAAPPGILAFERVL